MSGSELTCIKFCQLQLDRYYWGRSSNDVHFGPGVWPELAAFAPHSTTAIVMNGGQNATAIAQVCCTVARSCKEDGPPGGRCKLRQPTRVMRP